MPPVRGRELKLTLDVNSLYPSMDAPCAGARIETQSSWRREWSLRDAPCAGARIETDRQQGGDPVLPDAPCAGARIETVII